MKKIVSFALISVLFFACKKDSFDTQTFIVANKKVDVVNWAGATVSLIQVKESAADSFHTLGQNIEGFNYEEGFEYIIKVRVYKVPNPPADASSIRYELDQIISKK